MMGCRNSSENINNLAKLVGYFAFEQNFYKYLTIRMLAMINLLTEVDHNADLENIKSSQRRKD